MPKNGLRLARSKGVKSGKMQICGREVKALYLKDKGFFYVELLLKEGDCPEKKDFLEVEFCPGDCQGTYLSAIVKDEVIKIVGSIYPKPHIMYSEEFVKRHNLKEGEIEKYMRDYLDKNPCTIKSYMKGRKKRIYVGKEHVGTIFEGCVFRIAEGKFAELLAKMREKEIREILKNLEKIKKIAVPATTQVFGELNRYRLFGQW